MISPFVYVFTFIVGSLVGSFLNVISDRLLEGKSVFWGRSRCVWCKHKLSPKDLIPLLSFMLLKARCRYCGKKLSFYYPLSEVLTGFSFVWALHFSAVLNYYSGHNLLRLVFLLMVVCFYIVIFLSDAKYRIIPDKVIIPAVIFVFLFSLSFLAYGVVSYYVQLKGDGFGEYLLQAGWWHLQLFRALGDLGLTILSAVLIALFFRFLIFITKGRGMGFGDVKLGFLVGLVNGFPGNVLAIFLGFVFGAAYSLVFMALGKKTMKDTIPFGPFLVLGSMVSLVWGSAFLHWYLNLV